MPIVLLPLAFVEGPVGPLVGAEAMLHVGLPLALLLASIGPLEVALPVQLVVRLVALLEASCLHQLLARSVLKPVFEVTLVHRPVGLCLLAFPVFLVVLPLALLN